MSTTTIELRPRKAFAEFLESSKRWSCLVVHRRGGKTYASLQKLLYRAINDERVGPPKRYAYLAPTQIQAKDIAWGYLKMFTARMPGVNVNESELKITFAESTTIRLYSGENYERMRGLYLHGIVIDEPEDIDPLAWPEVIRPCLADYAGWAIWIGTIKGIEGQYQRYLTARDDPDWYAMLLKASESGIINEDELADMKRNLHPDIYAQELECEPRISRCVFTTSSLDYQDSLVALAPKQYGYLTHNEVADSFVWTPTEGDTSAMLVRWEQPRIGHRYLVSVDSSSGADQAGGEDPDSHSILVHRAGYMDEGGHWHPPVLAARNMMVPGVKPGSLACWWAEDILEQQVWLLCRYYNAFLVPEENHDRGLIETMRNKGIPIFPRQQFNHRENRFTEFLGWQTTAQTKPRIIARLEIAMRETLDRVAGGGYEIRCPWILKQMRNFGTLPNGRQEALFGHDDDVISVAIGNFTIDHATPFVQRVVERALPPEIQRMRDREAAGQIAPQSYS